MLSLMNEVDPCVAFAMCFVCDTKSNFPVYMTYETRFNSPMTFVLALETILHL